MRIIIDGGGTSTDVAVSVSNKIVARTQLSSFKPTRSETRTDEMCRALGSWLATVSVDVTMPSWILIGMSGIWTEMEKQNYLNDFSDSWLNYIAHQVPRVSVISDVELAHLAAHGNASGIVLIAGTGSIAVARLNSGQLLRCGGWGPRIDDGGSGFWIGREALKAVARMLDGRGPKTLLIRPVAAFLRTDPYDVDTVAAALRIASVDNCARLAPAVLQFATENDAVALSIREHAAEELTQLVAPLAQIALTEIETLEHGTLDRGTDHSLRIAYVGSLFKNNDFSETVSVRLAALYPNTVMRRVLDVVGEAALVFDNV